MKTVKQLLRQPLKSLFGILLIALAVAVLGVCLGQSMSAKKTETDLEYKFTTVALPTSNYNFKIVSSGQTLYLPYMNKDVAAWVDAQIEAHPELVETVARPGLASAYIPELRVDNHSQNGYLEIYEGGGGTILQQLNYLLPGGGKYTPAYSQAMFVVTLTDIGEPTTYPYTIILESSGEKVSRTDRLIVNLSGRIDQVLGLEEGFEDPTGEIIFLSYTLGSLEEFEEMGLIEGKQYVVYGVNYYWRPLAIPEYVDSAIENIARYNSEATASLLPYDEEKIYYLTEEDKAQWAAVNPKTEAPMAIYGDTGIIAKGIQWNNGVAVRIEVTNMPYPVYCTDTAVLLYDYNFQRVSLPAMSVIDSTVIPKYNLEDASLLETREITENGEKVTISWEEYQQRYGIPTIAPLEGSVEDFLTDNADWQQALEHIRINSHAFAVIGVEKLGYIADFARGQTRITQGRDFTQEELENGAKVCIISEQLAQINGLSVGDTINPQFYNYDYNVPYQTYLSQGSNSILPSAYFFNEHTEFQDEAVGYTVIGLYRQNDAWGDIYNNIYAFTPNTIFVPETSVTSDMDYGEQGVFRTVILKNGCIEEFEAVISQHEFEPMYGLEELRDLYVYYDQGYSQVKDSFHNYQKLAQQVLIVGIVVYGIVLVLFLLLYPGRQGKTLRTMANFGTPRKDKIAHVLVSSLGILLPGTILGSLLAMILWGVVVGRLLTVSGAMFSLTLDLGTLALIALAQLLLALALTLLLAIPMTKHENLMKRK